MDNEQDKIKSPMEVELKAGETYHWCACGKSSTQPFCDGSHECEGFAPLAFTAEKNETIEVCNTFFLCTCKQTKTPPYCDKTHKKF
ncbi:Iron-binding protein [Petrocella atlantisensis]|uniref:Iron-binding protein n=1 Tax=Petrocella atlantisensis TaxID=2173034 RepID=A0A3P7NZB5_9FIRM|nr:CDGSH iron-sulfur domain-containing protein [Petrocella atlantisensis]MCF8019533.1 CDGSH iron-sulfur domain-containing protein [Vallitaleaceae bacterium]VDN48285.1 Iron-binding protein [Petrocella atlantisensis]